MTNQLPQNTEAEQSVIASLLIEPKTFYTANSILSEDDFYYFPNRCLFKAIKSLYENDEPVVDVVILREHLEKTDEIKKIGVEYLLQTLDSLPTAANVEKYINIVKEKSVLRKAISLGEELKLLSLEEDANSNTILDKFSGKLFELLVESSGYKAKQDTITPQNMATTAIEKIEEATKHPGAYRGIAVNFPSLDFTTKGLREFTLLAADTGVGKTALALNWAVNLGIKKEIPCLYINCEMSVDDLSNRIISILSGVYEDNISMGKCTPSELKVVQKACETIHKSQLFITGNQAKTINNIVALIYKHKIQHGLKVVFIDYLGEIAYDDMAYKEQSEYMTYGRWAKTIKDVCAKLDVKPVIIHQLNREGQIASSMKLTRQASLFITIEKNEHEQHFIKIRKNRGGRCPAQIEVEFNKPTLTITEIKPQDEVPF